MKTKALNRKKEMAKRILTGKNSISTGRFELPWARNEGIIAEGEDHSSRYFSGG